MRKRALAGIAVAVVLTVIGGYAWWHAPKSEGPAATSSAGYEARPSAPEAAPVPPVPPVRYDVEYPAMAYSTTVPVDAVARLEERIAAGEVALERDATRGYLDAVLAALGIGQESQMLVFSRTSVQIDYIHSQTPRAIYYGDDVYVAWAPGAGSLEIAAVDPMLGPTFYTLDQDAASAPRFERQQGLCLRCHDSYSLTGGGVPRLITGSGYIGVEGELMAHEGWILTSDETPLRSRWGGWYVTGEHGAQVHLGNIVVRDVAQLQRLDEIRVGNLATLDGRIDTMPYLTDQSDIVALMVLEHQVHAQNAIVRANYDARTALDAATQSGAAAPVAADTEPGERAAESPDTTTDDGAATSVQLAAIAEPLVEALLLAGEAELTAPIRGRSGFAEAFEARGPRAADGRSLRELDLERRLFKYPLSYAIYSPGFDTLPTELRTIVYARLRAILGGEDESGTYARLTAADREAILAILADTKPEFAGAQ